MGNLQALLSVRDAYFHQLLRVLLAIGFTCLALFGLRSLVHGHWLLGGVLIVSAGLAVLFFAITRKMRHGNAMRLAVTLTCQAIIVTLLYTGGSNNTGLLWIYPLTQVAILTNNFRIGLMYALTTLAISATMVLSPLHALTPAEFSELESIRFVITLGVMAFMCLAMTYFNEREATSINQIHQKVQQLAYYDNLTGLANRDSFQQHLERVLPRLSERRDMAALLIIDLDDFKQVNARYGLKTGDALLQDFAMRLKAQVRASDDLARLSSDEFALFLPAIKDPLYAVEVAQRLLREFHNGYIMDGNSYPVHASIGISTFPRDGDNAEQLLTCGEAALSHAKAAGKQRSQLYDVEIAQDIEERRRILDGLRHALAYGEFKLALMPMYHARSRELVGVEVLLRCHSERLEGVGPDRFIPLAESNGLIQKLDLWVLEQAFSELARLRRQFGFRGQFCINISAEELHNEAFPDHVARLLNKYRLEAAQVELELTETSLVASDQYSVRILQRLKALGLSLALDDFGTGYTAFNQLLNYPVDRLKIDRSFIADLHAGNANQRKMVSIITSLAQLYQMALVAEGVENGEQLEMVKELGCHWVQGYYLSKPLSVEDFHQLLIRHDIQPANA